jgi:hypothetical protein
VPRYTIVQTAKLDGVNPEACLRDTLMKIAEGHPVSRIDELMPCCSCLGVRMRTFKFSLFADYFQFFIQDAAASGGVSQSWNAEAIARMLAIAPGTIGIRTVRNMHVPVSLEIHDQAPSDDFSEWDHVVECTLDARSGQAVIAGCTDYLPDAAHIGLAPGHYCARVSYGALDAVSRDGLSGDDHYRVQLWLGPPISARVVKQRSR